MLRVSDIVGKPIVSAAKGENIGKVADVLVNPGVTEVVGLVIAGGLFRSEHVLPFTDVQAFGKDAIVSRATEGAIAAREWRQQDLATMRVSTLRHRRVMTAAGRQLGAVKDLQLDEQTGAVQAFDVATPTFGGLSERRSIVPLTPGISVGPDAIMLPDEAAADIP